MASALIVIDLQNDYFPGGKWELNQTEKAAANAATLLAKARADKDVVVHIQHIAEADGPFFNRGTEGADIHASVKPIDGEPVVEKAFGNSFRGTNLKEILDKAGVKKVTICGAMSQMCIDAGVRASADFGFEVRVAHDACAARQTEFNGVTVPAEQVHAAFMSSLTWYAKLHTTEELLAA